MSDKQEWLQETAVQDLSAFHDVPWTMLEGMHAKFRITTDHVGLPSSDPRREVQSQTEQIREGVIVGRGEGRGLRYDSSGENAYMETRIGPAVYLDTPEDTILEVRTGKSENELLDIYPPHKYPKDE